MSPDFGGRKTIEPSDDKSTDWGYLIEAFWGHVVDEYLTDSVDEANRLVGANLEQGYAVRITRSSGIPVDVYRPDGYGFPTGLPPTEPALLARLRNPPKDAA